jgi:DNA repair exonuclease SbcCD ATPase subunit
LPSLIVQSRTAFQIARNAEAERWAQAEFRQARVALDTTEEMLRRAAPLEILEPSATETIRRSQQAIVMARERAAAAALEDAKAQIVTREREKTEAQTAIQQLMEEQKTADSRIQRLQSDLAEAERRLQQLTLEAEQNAERLRGAERDRAEFARREEELRNSLSFQLREDFFSGPEGSKVLTADGSEALTRISKVFGLMPAGPIRIRASFADAAIEGLVREFLVKAGVPADQIILTQR